MNFCAFLNLDHLPVVNGMFLSGFRKLCVSQLTSIAFYYVRVFEGKKEVGVYDDSFIPAISTLCL